ncbi:MAG: hypothetical protein JEY91_05750 [Spirochaetaceae bacterium]|nr:hypothetical protein [Spirochaetaceae bacterium]
MNNMIGIEYFAVFMCIGLPIICITLVKLKKHDSKKSSQGKQEILDEMYYAVKDMKKRISNLETILYDREKRS